MVRKKRLDQLLVLRKLAETRSQAGNYIKLGYIRVDDEVVRKPGLFISDDADIAMEQNDRYVSRAAYKLASVTSSLQLSFVDKVVLDIGSSTGGFTDYALQHGAKKVIAVDIGTQQMHPKLRVDERVELHEQTDFRNMSSTSTPIDIMVADVSFISLRDILPHAVRLAGRQTQIVAMVKPQFESGSRLKNKGVVKNDKIRRGILRDFELWAKSHQFVIQAKADSDVAGAKGNRERFYLLSVHA